MRGKTNLLTMQLHDMGKTVLKSHIVTSHKHSNDNYKDFLIILME